MKPMIRACAAGALALALAGAGASPALGATEAVSAPGMLAAPTGLTPDDSGTPYPHAVRKNVKLDWAPVAGATGYRVQVGRDSTWGTEPVLSQDAYNSEYTVPILLPNATYVWRVAALKGSVVGHWSSESGQAHAEAEFTHGWRAAPTPHAVVTPFVGRPTFSWTPVPDASGYELQVAAAPFLATSGGSSPDTSPAPGTSTQAPDPQLLAECFTARTRVTPFSDIVAKSGTVGGCKWAIPSDGTTVYWRVRALDAAATSEVGGPTEPASTAGVSETPPQDPNFLDKTCGSNPDDFDCEPIRASLAGSWSAAQSFLWTTSGDLGGSLATTVPTATLATDPDGLCTLTTDGSPTEAEHAVCRDVPTIRWAQATGSPVRYRLTFALDDALTNIQHVVETSATEFTVPGSWRDASGRSSYYYVVQACDPTVCSTVTSTPPSFSKVTPRLALGSNPTVAGEVRLTWQSYADALEAATGQAETQDAFSYHVEVATTDHPHFDAVVEHQIVDETYLSSTKSYGDGTFLWRVQPIDGAGNTLPWSLTKQFTRDATAPKVVTVSPSSAVAVKQPVNVTFSEPVTGVTAATLGLSPAVAHTVTVTGPTTATITPTAVMLPGATYRVVVTSAVKDVHGNVAEPLGPTFSVKTGVDDSSKAITYGGTWSVLSSSSAAGGRYHSAVPTATSKRSATMKFSGVGVSLRSCLGPSNGYLDIYVDNVKRKRVSLYRSYTGCGIKVASITGLARATHTIKLVGVGSHVSASKGNAVSVDHLTVSP